VQLELFSADEWLKSRMQFGLSVPVGRKKLHRALEFELFCLLMATVSQVR